MDQIHAYVSDGRWVAECPTCRSAILVKRFDQAPVFAHFGCIECGFGFAPQSWQALSLVPYQSRAQALLRLEGKSAEQAIASLMTEIVPVLLEKSPGRFEIVGHRLRMEEENRSLINTLRVIEQGAGIGIIFP